ncbi:MAG: DUF2961 domain-containing protein, partial [Bacteroidetes bacterium]|nr:DUF2961 domain-containing protein [Bacteroidota bacterium]
DLLEEKEKLIQGDSILLITSRGKKAIYELQLDIDIQDSSAYASVMHQLILSAQFDGKQTIWAPLSDFSGGGMGAPMVESWFISSDGKGRITSRWVMPYKKEAIVCLKNLSDQEVGVHMQIKTAPYKWDSNTLYFHTSWKQNNNLHLFHCADDVSNPDAYPFNMITITGKGVMRGDLLSLINYSQSWYGEGDETIWVDEDTFPSHFGTGTEDYYNSSWAPVYVFHTPFGGAIRADSTNSRGHNTWLRTRNLDEIPFRKHLKFDFELLSWFVGEADYSSTIFWYGDKDAHALGSSRIEDAKRMLETR